MNDFPVQSLVSPCSVVRLLADALARRWCARLYMSQLATCSIYSWRGSLEVSLIGSGLAGEVWAGSSYTAKLSKFEFKLLQMLLHLGSQRPINSTPRGLPVHFEPMALRQASSKSASAWNRAMGRSDNLHHVIVTLPVTCSTGLPRSRPGKGLADDQCRFKLCNVPR